jgi:hypothetical protein
MYAGNLYYPAGAQVFFNANEMVRSGFYMGVPLYVRTTLEPFSVVFVPIGRGLMQPYERPRSGDLAGTAGSTTSNFPVVVATDSYQPALMQSIARPEPTAPEPSKVRPIVTAGLRTRIGPRPHGINAVFVEFRGRRWYKAGDPVPFDASRMVRIGERAGFPVFADDVASVKRLFIPVTRDSPFVLEYTPSGPND